jgi:hypothetical protein
MTPKNKEGLIKFQRENAGKMKKRRKLVIEIVFSDSFVMDDERFSYMRLGLEKSLKKPLLKQFSKFDRKCKIIVLEG